MWNHGSHTKKVFIVSIQKVLGSGNETRLGDERWRQSGNVAKMEDWKQKYDKLWGKNAVS